LRNLPVGACLDTAHLFAAGYDIKSEGGLASTIGQIDGAIGLENVPVIHMNDSKIPLGGAWTGTSISERERLGRRRLRGFCGTRDSVRPRRRD